MNSQRYIRQTTLRDFGPKAQQKLQNARVLVIGLGGLGIPVLQYLNAMGVGTLGLIEQDIIEITNLQRQVLYGESDIGKNKLEVALQKLKDQNSTTNFKTYDTFLTRNNALEIIRDFDLVVDASDNFPTRYLVNDACVILKKPFVYGALHSFEGQVSVFNYDKGPTYRCLFPIMPSAEEIPNCNDNGVLGVIPGIIGNLQALEAVKVITGVGTVLSGQLLIFDGLSASMQKINFKSRPESYKITELQETYDAVNCFIVNDIDVNAFQRLRTTANIQVIDVRSSDEYENYHLSDTKNVPLSALEEHTEEINLKEEIYLLCQSGKRSQMAYQLLKERFPTASIFNVKGGLNHYTAQYS